MWPRTWFVRTSLSARVTAGGNGRVVLAKHVQGDRRDSGALPLPAVSHGGRWVGGVRLGLIRSSTNTFLFGPCNESSSAHESWTKRIRRPYYCLFLVAESHEE